MKTASQELLHEHVHILEAVDIIEKINVQVKDNKEPARSDIQDILTFMKEYVEDCHHEKEEHYLFPAIDDADESSEHLTEELKDEHHESEKYVKELKEYIEDDEFDKSSFTKTADSLIKLLRHHIEEENTKLFPISDQKLPEPKQQELLREFGEFEEKEIGKGRHEELHQLIIKLKEKYLK